MSSTLEKHWKRSVWLANIVAIMATAGALLTGCGEQKKEEGEKSAEAVPSGPPVSVVVMPVVQKTVPIYTELTARTDANDSVDIRARVKAFLEKQTYEEGKMVKAGQVLFTLDKREYE